MEFKVQFTDVNDKTEDINIVLYPTLEKLTEKLFQCPIEELDTVGFVDVDGKEEIFNAKEYLKTKRKEHCDGFTDYKTKTIHIWFDKDKVEERTLMEMLSHEKGHLTKPIHRDDLKEELKAETISQDAMFAYDLMVTLRSGIHSG